MKERYEDQLDSLRHQANNQLALIQSLENLELENSTLRKAYDKLLDENNRLKREYGVKGKKLEIT